MIDLQYVFYRFLKKIKKDFPKKEIINNKKARHFLLGSVEHMNYGDQAINLAETCFFSKNGIRVIEIPESYLEDSFDLLKKYVRDDDVFYFHGGGNMGDVWPMQERWRQKVMQLFPTNRLVFLPQSVNYSENSKLLADTINLAEKTENLTIYLRDMGSYSFSKNVFPKNVRLKLVPDSVLTLDYSSLKDEGDEFDITTLMRKDSEKLKSVKVNFLLTWLEKQKKYQIHQSDTVRTSWKNVTSNTRAAFLREKMREVASSRLIITDRLHGMVFAYITGRPVIVFDNNNHKIKNLYKTWLGDEDTIFFVDENINNNEILAKIDYFMHTKVSRKPKNGKFIEELNDVFN